MSSKMKKFPEAKVGDIVPALRFDHAHPDALAVYCSDGRFTAAVEHLLECLGHERLDTLTIPGGAALLDLTSAHLNEIEVMRRSATFLITGHKIKHVVLVGHEGCGYYKSKFPYESPEAMFRRQTQDLVRAAGWVKADWPDMKVHTFFAVPDGEHVRFDEVAP